MSCGWLSLLMNVTDAPAAIVTLFGLTPADVIVTVAPVLAPPPPVVLPPLPDDDEGLDGLAPPHAPHNSATHAATAMEPDRVDQCTMLDP